MNTAGQKAIKQVLGNLRDDLYRYRHFAKPTDLVGGGPETAADVIVALEEKERDLVDALREAQS